MNDFEIKLKEIAEINDTWEVKSFYGHTKYYSFLKNTYCVSICEHNNSNLKSYVLSKKDKMLYVGNDETKVLKSIKKAVDKAKKGLKENENKNKTN